ncbi:MAG: class I SAM-dependent methyltransferase [Candidatus Margulisiibacteriota bacterium]|nr:MAG: class I SAM-dependent methyltransferase [Candidatus Margulisiibacteriota bacterium]HCY36201.1 class I SAM-dependent methyltransferase [Candidatus Margulisiibacteriota bacterium]
MNTWIYNEFKHCGVDYADVKQAENYDNQHQKFRNYEQELIGMIEFLSLQNTQEMTLIDLGCGTGATAILASAKFKRIYAVDVSEVMINQAKTKMATINNIEFINSGFLSYEHKAEPADIVLTKAAFHHLPDFWKQIALINMNKMLKPGGILYIFDIVFHFEPTEYKNKINDWVTGFEIKAGKEFRTEVETHIRDEFSTFNWVMEGMLKKAGFIIEKSRTSDGFITEYFCKKVE